MNDTADLILFEGIISFRAVISTYETDYVRKIVKLKYAEERIAKNKSEYLWICHTAERNGFEVQTVSLESINEEANGKTHGGIIFYCEDRFFSSLSAEKLKRDGIYYMIEGVEDPFNFGYAIRTLYAAGADGIILSPRNWFTSAGTVCKSSAGASEQIPIFITESASDAVDIFKNAGYKIVAADIADSVSVYDADLSLPALVIIGGEKRGISRLLLSKTDIIVRLDYGRNFPNALSTASAASVLSYEVFRQNRDKYRNINITDKN